MTYGRIINGFKYIRLMNSNNFKFNTLNDNVYFTLRDIFANADSADTVMEANDFNSRLTGDVLFEDRTIDFVYTNVLEQKYFVEKLLLWLKYFNIHFFQNSFFIGATALFIHIVNFFGTFTYNQIIKLF